MNTKNVQNSTKNIPTPKLNTLNNSNTTNTSNTSNTLNTKINEDDVNTDDNDLLEKVSSMMNM